ncbi:Na/Pi cotransporter family protein [Pseudovibrio exalbescens]|uniref:Na/Pi cotransporter n=1 Tax=Pseudovibrio exalbescens TaxID=197461 RepID=A0A1U7JF35_9HYPH|nr:Na/Pi symporter [Pseudovibrio exalbescens]OKL43315.1 Na/Pi cotransporter [Pseudovibrio exalbescens]
MMFSLLSALGGVGLFLMGMHLLTSGTKALAGSSLRSALGRFTATPLSGAATGAVTTAIIQSSSATTVAAVGFVASGLLTFPQALGIIFGANIGTTITGWFVAILGFKLDLGEMVLPLVFVGALLTLMGRGRVAMTGQALAGFSLLFIGIDHLKDGLDAFQGTVTPTDFPSDDILGRLQLVGLGVLITLVTQSSSAGVATALAALGAGAINYPQAAALVIGMDVGTTFTAALATLGGGTMARRTGFAHVIYNVLTGTMAFFIVVPFSVMVEPLVAGGNAQIALVAFHSSFNLLGVLLILPFAQPFARLVEWLVPERGASLTRSLDPMVLSDPKTAVGLASAAVERVNAAVIAHLSETLGEETEDEEPHDRSSLETALSETRDYLNRIDVPKDQPDLKQATGSLFHVLDHLTRLLYRCDQEKRIDALSNDARLSRLRTVLLSAALHFNSGEDPQRCEDQLDRVRQLMRTQRKSHRDRIISAAIADEIDDEEAALRLDGLRWLHRVAYHMWRIKVHLNSFQQKPVAPVTQTQEARLEVGDD